VAGESVEDFRELTKRIGDQEGVAGIELNVSCPNVAGGLDFSTDPKLTHQVVKAAREATRLPIIPKLSPNVTDINTIARAAEDAGADGLSLINTLVGMAIDVRTRRPKIANVTGGLSGPAIRPVAVRMVWQVRHAVRLPILGMGGIVTGEDAVEFLLPGPGRGWARLHRPERCQGVAAAGFCRPRDRGGASARGGSRFRVGPQRTRSVGW
jgi:dihydroorotate dehydrogenase (NAD+) catalytic subunit